MCGRVEPQSHRDTAHLASIDEPGPIAASGLIDEEPRQRRDARGWMGGAVHRHKNDTEAPGAPRTNGALEWNHRVAETQSTRVDRETDPGAAIPVNPLGASVPRCSSRTVNDARGTFAAWYPRPRKRRGAVARCIRCTSNCPEIIVRPRTAAPRCLGSF